MFKQQTILIVEDEPIIALTVAAAVEDAGGHVIGPVATVAEAMVLVDDQRIAAAILDARLVDRDVTPVAVALAKANVPFVVYSGTGLPSELAAILPNTPLVMKPASMAVVLARLAEQMGSPDQGAKCQLT